MTVDHEQLAAAAAALRAAMESEDSEVEITGPDGSPMRIIKSPEPGVKARIEVAAGDSESMVNVLWEPSEVRPSKYPDSLPFIPNTAVSTSTVMVRGSPRTQVQWFGIENPDTVVERLVEESLAEGWQHTRIQPSMPEPTRMITFDRGGQGRTITCVAAPGFGMVSLFDSGPTVAD